MDNDIIQLLLRNIGSLVSGILIARGYASAGNQELIIGIVVGIGMLVYSWWSKRQAKARLEATAAVALALPSHATPTDLNQALAVQNVPPVDADALGG